jgi:Kef-type K+ transport system membrane component KefB
MKALLSPRIHGYGDYLIVALLALAPSLFDFSGLPAVLCYVLAVVQLGMSLLTAYPLGVAKIIPFTVHGTIEAVTSIALVLMPFLFGFSRVDSARNFFVILGIGLFLVWLTTNYKAAERPIQGGVGLRRRVQV